MLKIKDVFEYLQKNNLGDQIHIRDSEIVIYHWNRNMSDLKPSVVFRRNKIEQVYYSRTVLPKIYTLINMEVENDLEGNEKYVRDKRG